MWIHMRIFFSLFFKTRGQQAPFISRWLLAKALPRRRMMFRSKGSACIKALERFFNSNKWEICSFGGALPLAISERAVKTPLSSMGFSSVEASVGKMPHCQHQKLAAHSVSWRTKHPRSRAAVKEWQKEKCSNCFFITERYREALLADLRSAPRLIFFRSRRWASKTALKEA